MKHLYIVISTNNLYQHTIIFKRKSSYFATSKFRCIENFYYYEISHAEVESYQDPEIVMGEAVSAPSTSLIKAAESSTVLAPIDTAIEEANTASLE